METDKTALAEPKVKKTDRPTVAEKEYWTKRAGALEHSARYDSISSEQMAAAIKRLGIQKELKAYCQAKQVMKQKAAVVESKLPGNHRYGDPEQLVEYKAKEMFRSDRIHELQQLADAVMAAATRDELTAAVKRIRDMEGTK